MKRLAVAIAGTLVMLGCSADTEGEAAKPECFDITGNFSIKVTKVGGSCDAGDGDASISIVKEADGYNVYLPGINGGCPGELDAATCKYTALCEIVNGRGDLLASYNLSYTFYGETFSGSLVGTVGPPIVTTACDSNVKHDGTRL